MKKDFTIRFYRPGDEKEIVPLLVLGFHGWPHIDLACSPLEHWRWKYIDNPIKRNMIAVMRLIIGICLFIFFSFFLSCRDAINRVPTGFGFIN